MNSCVAGRAHFRGSAGFVERVKHPRHHAVNRSQYVVLPNANDPPAKLAEGRIRSTVGGDVTVELRSPECDVGGWAAVVVRTPVPEAAVDEYSEPSTWKAEIGSARKFRSYSVPQACGPERPPEA